MAASSSFSLSSFISPVFFIASCASWALCFTSLLLRESSYSRVVGHLVQRWGLVAAFQNVSDFHQ